MNSHDNDLPVSVCRRRALVADDSETILHAICSLLEHYQLAEITGRASNAMEALEIAAVSSPDFALIDIDMPGVNGLTTALLLSQAQPATKVILMSMEPTSQQRIAGAGCGAWALISKPRFIRELRALFERDAAFPVAPPERAPIMEMSDSKFSILNTVGARRRRRRG
jgi:DNA-binding NarL/FixJ family response regulator